MPIKVEWQNEEGEVLSRYEGFITIDFIDRAAPSTVCLRFIDLYGDTTFNRYQLPVLIEELEALAGQVDGTTRESIRSLLVFLRGTVDQVHTYVKFIGD